jgi:signal peptidase II
VCVVQEHGTRPPVVGGRRHTGVVAAVAAAVIIVDQLTKTWAVNALADRDIDLFWSARFHLTHNTGAAFSFGFGSGGLVALIAIGVVILLIAIGRGIDTKVGSVSLGLVLGGALGNLTDRIFREGSGFLGGRVVDFIVAADWWAVFNVADIGITVGGVMLVLFAARE